jgi:hypothetical protein
MTTTETRQTDTRCGSTTWTGHDCGGTRTETGCTNQSNHQGRDRTRNTTEMSRR